MAWTRRRLCHPTLELQKTIDGQTESPRTKYNRLLNLFGHVVLPWRKPWAPPRAQRITGRKRIRRDLWAIIEDDPEKNYASLLAETEIPHSTLVKFLTHGDDDALTDAQAIACAGFCAGFGRSVADGKLIRLKGLVLKWPDPPPPKPPVDMRHPSVILAEIRAAKLAKINPLYR